MSRILSLAYRRELAESEPGTERGLDRLVAFTDAVVAIAITLIVLPLVDIAAADGATPTALFDHDGSRFAAAAVTFSVVGSLWRGHHVVFERARTYTSPLLTINLVWLAAIVFLPVPTTLLFSNGNRAEEGIAVAVYTATLAVAQLAMAISSVEIDRRCLRTDAERAPRGAWPAWVSVGVTVLASVLALAGLGTSALWFLLLNLPAEWVALELTRRRLRRKRAAGPAPKA